MSIQNVSLDSQVLGLEKRHDLLNCPPFVPEQDVLLLKVQGSLEQLQSFRVPVSNKLGFGNMARTCSNLCRYSLLEVMVPRAMRDLNGFFIRLYKLLGLSSHLSASSFTGANFPGREKSHATCAA